jgi:hypothetical protein
MEHVLAVFLIRDDAAVSVRDGVFDTLILPNVNSECMQKFLDEISSRHHEDGIVMILDGAGWHKS